MKNKKKVYNKSQKKYVNKRLMLISILVLLIIFIIFVIVKITNGKNVDNDTQNYFDTLSPEEKSAISGNNEDSKNVFFDNSGTKINTSNGINKTIKLDNDIFVDNILLFANDGKSVVSFNINNTSNSIYSSTKIEVRLLDEDGNLMHSFKKDVPQVLSNSKIILEDIVEEDISNASSIDIKFIK